jgi:hypothetical protein
MYVITKVATQPGIGLGDPGDGGDNCLRPMTSVTAPSWSAGHDASLS